MIITIDGPSGVGKSSAAKAVAKALNFHHIDTGAMYRAYTHLFMQGLSDPKSFDYRVEFKNGEKRHIANGQDVTDVIRSREVTTKVSEVSALANIREAIVAIQRKIGQAGNCVFEGRDLGTVVFPSAEYKIYLTASPEVRAKRRHVQLKAVVSEEEILAEQERRDTHDSTRKVSPLRPADDAWILDTSELTLEQVTQKILEHVK